MKTLEIELPWPPRGLSPNARLTVFAKALLFKKTKQLACLKTKQKLAGESVRLAEGSRMNLKLICTPPILRYHDEDNLLANCKATLDGIAMAMKINDHLFHFREQEWHQPQKPGSLRIAFDWEEAHD
jgi:crossover junction endodeoxyribonuclease RusA